MEEKKRVRPSLKQMRALQAELADVAENYRLQLLANERLMEEIDAVKLKLKRTMEQLYKVSMERGSLVKVSDGYSREMNEVLRQKLCICEEKLDSQLEGTSYLVKDCDAWRDSYRELYSEKQLLERKCKDCTNEIANLKQKQSKNESSLDSFMKLEEKYNSLKDYSKQMENHLAREIRLNKSLRELNEERLSRIQHLMSRGFWARLFNM